MGHRAMKIPVFRIRTALVAVAVIAVLLYTVIIPLWDHYHLPKATRIALAKLDRTIRVAADGPIPLGEIIRVVRTDSVERGDDGIPVHVDPIGLEEARVDITKPVEIGPDQVRLKAFLDQRLGPLGLSDYVEDGLLTITSKQAADRALRRSPRQARRP